MKIVAIDPGYERIGIAVLERERGQQKETLLYSVCFKTDKKLDLNQRIFLIGCEIERIITTYQPKVCAIEKLFFTTNQKTVMGVSEARGVCIYSAMRNDLLIAEYTPLEIKMAITGYGKADKGQIMRMLPKLIKFSSTKTSDDELDAMAIGLTCFAIERF